MGKRLLIITCLVMLCFAVAVNAQPDVEGTLIVGQPSIGFLPVDETLSYSYTLEEARGVTIQAIGDAMQPTIAILRDGSVVASNPNSEGQSIVALNAILNAGTYIVQVGTANSTTGTVILVVQSEIPISAIPLTAGSAISGEVSVETPVALYSFTALTEQAFLYAESGLPESGANVRLVNTTTGRVSGTIGSDMAGGRFRIPAGTSEYQVEVLHSGSISAEPFTLCLIAVSAGDCGDAVVQPVQTQEVEVSTAACTVTPTLAGGANIRQSANVNSIIVGALSGGAVADVLGISPDGSFYNVQYNNIVGWMALSAVTASGDCSNLPTVNPPAPILIPTPTPIPPSPTPIPPTPVPPTPTPTQSGPCLIMMTGEAYIYTMPVASPENIQDQVDANYQLIPTGRLADNSWWKIGNAWIETHLFGSVANVTGDCSQLPIVSP
ncbi:MAG TPA: hypothetical protein VK003_06460 [Oceanobacillus sp.]|nr:hypothetical protein [Oceanobacillus sp.]